MSKNKSSNNVYVKINDASDVDNLENLVVGNVGKSKTFPNNTRNHSKRSHDLMMADDDKVMRLYASMSPDQKRLKNTCQNSKFRNLFVVF